MKVLRAAFVALLLASASCGDGTAPLAELQRAMKRWDDAGPASYTMTLRFLCGECLPDAGRTVIVTVTNGVVTSRVYETGGAPADPELASLWPDVAGLFGKIGSLIDEGADRLDVRYHPTLGYPQSISTDPNTGTVDDEHGWIVSALSPSS